MLRYITKFQTRLFQLDDEHGATAVEYALMVALIAVFIITAVSLLGTSLAEIFNSIAGTLDTARA